MVIPQHIGIIMDGNGRWARQRGLPRTLGHRAGVDAVRTIVSACGELGVRYLTVYVFSAENWGRPKTEVSLLMDLLCEMIGREVGDLNRNNVRLNAIGNLDRLPEKAKAELLRGIQTTSPNTGLNLILAISYGGRAEIVEAAKTFARLAAQNPDLIDKLDEPSFSRFLYTADIPDPELIIRTGGEKRISNFLLWQCAYTEFFITDVLWPDFSRERLMEAIDDFGRRERRFGKVQPPR